ncbi:hypothetical protein ACU60L_02385 [Klebsiella aerogenes]
MKTLKVTITNLQQIKNGVVCGAKVTFKVIQSGCVLVEKVVSGKVTGPFTLSYDVDANDDPLVVEHNRPDIPGLDISAVIQSWKIYSTEGKVDFMGGQFLCQEHSLRAVGESENLQTIKAEHSQSESDGGIGEFRVRPDKSGKYRLEVKAIYPDNDCITFTVSVLPYHGLLQPLFSIEVGLKMVAGYDFMKYEAMAFSKAAALIHDISKDMVTTA